MDLTEDPAVHVSFADIIQTIVPRLPLGNFTGQTLRDYLQLPTR